MKKIICGIMLLFSLFVLADTNDNILSATGYSIPDATGIYTISGIYNNAPCYSNANWCLWWKADWAPGVYLISKNVGDVSSYWISLNPGDTNKILGVYTNNLYNTRGSLIVTNIPFTSRNNQ